MSMVFEVSTYLNRSVISSERSESRNLEPIMDTIATNYETILNQLKNDPNYNVLTN